MNSNYETQQSNETHALVIGGSMAGLLAARVLSDTFDRVTVIDRDALPDAAEFRTGAPMGRHLHNLLARGQQIMEDLFPGLTQDLEAIGAPMMRYGLDNASYTPAGWMKRFDSGVKGNLVSRIALEYMVRQRLLGQGRVTLLDQTDMLGYVTNHDHSRVLGIHVQSRETKIENTLTADLVVDASGRNGKTLDWLTAIGYDAPEEQIVTSNVGYATRWYKRPQNPVGDWRALLVFPRPAEGLKRGGGMMEVEGARWAVTLTGTNADYPPTDEAGFMDYARTFASPALYEAIKHAEPISPIFGYRYQGSRMRRFDRVRMPERLLVMGDAACSFNPIYGQGMTAAALEALELRKVLRRAKSLDGIARPFQRRLIKAVDGAWLMATAEDLRYPDTEGNVTLQMRISQIYTDWVIKALPYDRVVGKAFINAMNLTIHPMRLMRPDLLLRVLRHNLLPHRQTSGSDSVNFRRHRTAEMPVVQ